MWQKEFGTNVWLIKRRECILYLSEKDWLLICKRLANAVMDHWTLYTRMLVDQIKSAHEVELVTCSLLQMIKLGRPTEIWWRLNLKRLYNAAAMWSHQAQWILYKWGDVFLFRRRHLMNWRRRYRVVSINLSRDVLYEIQEFYINSTVHIPWKCEINKVHCSLMLSANTQANEQLFIWLQKRRRFLGRLFFFGVYTS